MNRKKLIVSIGLCCMLCVSGGVISSCDNKQRDSLAIKLMSDDKAYKELQEATETVNKACPIQTDDRTVMEGASFNGNKWTYHYTIQEDTLIRFDNEVFNASIAAGLKESTRKNIYASPNMLTMIKALIKVKADLVYQYRGSVSGKAIDVVFTYPELRVMNDVMSNK